LSKAPGDKKMPQCGHCTKQRSFQDDHELSATNSRFTDGMKSMGEWANTQAHKTVDSVKNHMPFKKIILIPMFPSVLQV